MSDFEAAIVMPAFNGQATIHTALESVAASVEAARRSVVISVADDCSTDGTVAVVEAFAARSAVPIVVTRRRHNGGTGAARNTAADAVDVPILLFLDQDDDYLPNHVAVCLAALDQQPSIDFVKTQVVLDRAVHDDWVLAIAGSLTQNLAVRRHAHRLVGGFLGDRHTAAVGCDDVFYNRLLAEFCRGRTLEEPTVRFRHHPGNSFDRQYDAKFSRPIDEAVPTLTPERAAHGGQVEALFGKRQREVAARMKRLGRLTPRAR